MKKISFKEHGNNQWGIPTVNFLISGDINDLMRVRLGLSERQPLVVMKGSGGAAEVVSESLNYFRTKDGFNNFEPAFLSVYLYNGFRIQDFVSFFETYNRQKSTASINSAGTMRTMKLL